MDCSSPGSSVHGISQARILEWLPFLSPGDLPHPQIKPASSAFASGFFTTEPPGNPDPGHLWGNTSFYSWPLCAHETQMMDLLVDLCLSHPGVPHVTHFPQGSGSSSPLPPSLPWRCSWAWPLPPTHLQPPRVQSTILHVPPQETQLGIFSPTLALPPDP